MRVAATLLAAVLFAAGIAAGGPDPATAPAGGQDTVRVDVVAVHAFSENRGAKVYDKDLQDIKEALSDLEFDTYRKLSSTTLRAALNDEASYKINSKYTLYVKPLSREASGQVRLSIRVQMAAKDPAGKPINAVATTLSISPDKKLKLRGLKLDNGELVVVLLLRG